MSEETAIRRVQQGKTGALTLVLPKKWHKLLGIKKGAYLKISLEGKTIVITGIGA